MRKWEYRVVDLIKEIEKERSRGAREHWVRTSDLEKLLNKLGEQGWELVDTHFKLDRKEAVVVGLFKRPL